MRLFVATNCDVTALSLEACSVYVVEPACASTLSVADANAACMIKHAMLSSDEAGRPHTFAVHSTVLFAGTCREPNT